MREKKRKFSTIELFFCNRKNNRQDKRNVMCAHETRKWSLANILMCLLLPVLTLLVLCCSTTTSMHLATATQSQSKLERLTSFNTAIVSDIASSNYSQFAESGEISAAAATITDITSSTTKMSSEKSINHINSFDHHLHHTSSSNLNESPNESIVPSILHTQNSQKMDDNDAAAADTSINKEKNLNLNDNNSNDKYSNNKLDKFSNDKNIIKLINNPVETSRISNALNMNDDDGSIGTRSKNELVDHIERTKIDRRQQPVDENERNFINRLITIDSLRRSEREVKTRQRLAYQMRIKRARIDSHHRSLRHDAIDAYKIMERNRRESQRSTASTTIATKHNPFANTRIRKRRFCSARDPTTLAFEAPTVFEGKIRSMSSDRRHNFSVTFEVKEIYKRQMGLNLPLLVRLKFAYRNSSECDIYREQFRSVGYVRDELEPGRLYILFVDQIDVGNYTILGQPIKRNRKTVTDVRIGVNETYGEFNLHFLFAFSLCFFFSLFVLFLHFFQVHFIVRHIRLCYVKLFSCAYQSKISHEL